MEQTQSQEMRQEMRQVLRMEQANMLEMPEDEFHKLITEIEHSPLFCRLNQEKLIHFERFPRTDIASSFYQIREEAVADEGSADIESLLLGKECIISQIQRLGLDRFKRYFLFPEAGMTNEEIARDCDLEVAAVQRINELIDEVSVISEFSHTTKDTSGGIHYFKVASIEGGSKGFVIGYFSAHFARGRYSVDYESFENLKTSGALTGAEVKEARQLFKKLELINSRKDTLTRILQDIIDKQALYLESGDPKSLLPYRQKELAEAVGLAPSSVSRAIAGKSIDTPWGKEIPIKDFFPRPKKFRQERLRQLLETGGFSSDEAIRTRLREEFGVAISRRSVANLRQGMKFPAARGHRAARIRGT